MPSPFHFRDLITMHNFLCQLYFFFHSSDPDPLFYLKWENTVSLEKCIEIVIRVFLSNNGRKPLPRPPILKDLGWKKNIEKLWSDLSYPPPPSYLWDTHHLPRSMAHSWKLVVTPPASHYPSQTWIQRNRVDSNPVLKSHFFIIRSSESHRMLGRLNFAKWLGDNCWGAYGPQK